MTPALIVTLAMADGDLIHRSELAASLRSEVQVVETEDGETALWWCP